MKSCLPPVVDAGTRLLILGSLPGDASLAAARYYAHPRNGFWSLLEAVLAIPLVALPYEARLPAILAHRVGLWDVVGQARRPGSLDGALRDVTANDLPGLVATLPRLEAVAFNGKTAARLGRAALEPTALRLIDLPSSSPALTTAFALKREVWVDALSPLTVLDH